MRMNDSTMASDLRSTFVERAEKTHRRRGARRLRWRRSSNGWFTDVSDGHDPRKKAIERPYVCRKALYSIWLSSCLPSCSFDTPDSP